MVVSARTFPILRAFPNCHKWGKLTPDQVSSLVKKESVDDAYQVH